MTLDFTCGEKKSWSNIKKSQNIMSMVAWKFYLLLAPFVKNSHILAEI